MTHADETRADAQRFDHPWDRRALDWPLDERSIVVEVGGYKGRWALQIAERYHPRLYVFEPQPWAAQACSDVLGERANVYAFALGITDGTFPMGDWGTDGCSFFKEPNGEGVMREIGGIFTLLGIRDGIDLMLMNIEGYEYQLIPHMLDRGILPRRLMVQYHPFTDEQAAIGTQIDARMGALGYTVPWTYGVSLSAYAR